jgi:ribosomal protein S5
MSLRRTRLWRAQGHCTVDIQIIMNVFWKAGWRTVIMMYLVTAHMKGSVGGGAAYRKELGVAHYTACIERDMIPVLVRSKCAHSHRYQTRQGRQLLSVQLFHM